MLQKYKTKIEEANIEAGKIINNEKKETEIFIKETENKFYRDPVTKLHQEINTFVDHYQTLMSLEKSDQLSIDF